MKDIVKEWYENKDNVSEMVQWDKGILKKWEQYVATYFKAQGRILNVGCGMGREAYALADMGFLVTGIDISKEVIEQVSCLSGKKGYNIPFLHYDGHKFPSEDESFDAVIIWAQTFGLLYGDEYKKEFLKECKRVLTKDGVLSFSTHDYEFLMDNYSSCMKGRKFYPYGDSEICWEAFLRDELIAFAENGGFHVILCDKGEIYKKEDGTILHCLCRRNEQ